MNTAQRQHWEYQERRARKSYWSKPGAAEALKQKAREHLKQRFH